MDQALPLYEIYDSLRVYSFRQEELVYVSQPLEMLIDVILEAAGCYEGS
jgi:hypothetical protein